MNNRTKWCQEKAKKSILNEIGSPNILHIVTHGEYKPQFNEEFSFTPSSGHSLSSKEDPLTQCGLVFSGVNNFRKSQNIPDEYGNGSLTAKEVLSINLPKTDLLVLSACETGLGEVNNGEVYEILKNNENMMKIKEREAKVIINNEETERKSVEADQCVGPEGHIGSSLQFH